MYEKMTAFYRQKERWIVLLILIAGAALRLSAIGQYPPGLNQDEASAGYEAWSLLNYGMDRNGCEWPVLFKSWGSGQNVLYSYLSMPFVALLGLNGTSIRMTAGVFGSISLLLFYGFAKRVRGTRFAFWGILALALNPWHVLISRWALESNLLPFTLLLGCYCLARVKERQQWLFGAAAAFGLSLYAYGTAYVFLPLFLTAGTIILLQRRAVSLGCLWSAAALFVLVSFPITLCNVRNVLGLGETKLLWMTLPALNEARQAETTVFGGFSVIENFNAFVDLIWRQSDGLPFNTAGRYGIFYGRLGLAVALLGLCECVMRRITGKSDPDEIWPLLAVAVSMICAFIIKGNINRMNMLLMPIVYFQAAGLNMIGRKWLKPVLALSVLLVGVFFVNFYFTGYAGRLRYSFQARLDEAMDYAKEMTDDTVWISDAVNMPYIYVLFYEQIPPNEYLDTVVYVNPGEAFENVIACAGWRFGTIVPKDGTLCIMNVENTEAMEVLAEFGDFAVAKYSE